MEGPAAMSQATQTQTQTQAQTPSRSAGPGSGAAFGAAPPNLLYTEDETALRDAVRSLLADQAGWRDVLARTESDQTYDTGLWQKLAQQVGCAGLLVPEDAGGAGASCREAAVVAEELGRSAAAVPFLGSAGVAGALWVAGLRAPGRWLRVAGWHLLAVTVLCGVVWWATGALPAGEHLAGPLDLRATD
ncbi:MAG: acyl-CoA dehydrogenase family protein, partial [Actinomycetota bacterium]|nr:acyl-CoA dehydrogenase family protein [Actinomycetota bacterium]